MYSEKQVSEETKTPKNILARISGANGLTNFADVLGLTALPLLAAMVTDSPTQIAGLSVVQQLPWLLLTLPIGVWLDRINRKKVYIWVTLLSFIITLAFSAVVFLGYYHMLILYMFMLLSGMTETIRDSASPIIVREVVGKNNLKQAYGTFTSARLIGEAIAGSSVGLLFSRLTALPFFIQSGAIAGAVGLMSTLKGDFSQKPKENDESFFKKLGAGFSWLWKDKLTRHLTILSTILNFFSRFVFAIFILYVLNVVELSVTLYGVISLFFTAGGIFGAWISKYVSGKLGDNATLGLSLLLISLSYFLMAFLPFPIVSAIFMFMIAVGIFIWNIISTSLWRGFVPNDLQGRVGSVFQFFTWGIGPIGAMAGGIVASVFALSTTLWISGAGMLAASLYSWIFLKR